MIDHLMTFSSEAAAKADPVVGPYWIDDGQGSGGAWRGDCCIPGIFVWRPADQSVVTLPDGSTSIIRRPYDGNWRLAIAHLQPNPVLCASPACHLVTDRDAAAAGQPFVLQSVLSAAELATLALEPVFAGSNYPFGVES
jgi:hypothetical protein